LCIFETNTPHKTAVFQKSGQRPRVTFTQGLLEDLGAGLTLGGGQPLLVTLQPGADSGPVPIVHTGQELVYCLEGTMYYSVDEDNYILELGDSLIFEAHLPHRWGNAGEVPSRSLLILCPADENDHPTDSHFIPKSGS
jgi:quercetin dioxygenase-like cupin family protein